MTSLVHGLSLKARALQPSVILVVCAITCAVPSALYGLGRRGQLREGWAADVVLFDAARLGLQRTELVHDLPGGAARLIQRPRGITHVIVNGAVLIDEGAQTDARSGRVLRGA